jgi:hypothetical protein
MDMRRGLVLARMATLLPDSVEAAGRTSAGAARTSVVAGAATSAADMAVAAAISVAADTAAGATDK